MCRLVVVQDHRVVRGRVIVALHSDDRYHGSRTALLYRCRALLLARCRARVSLLLYRCMAAACEGAVHELSAAVVTITVSGQRGKENIGKLRDFLAHIALFWSTADMTRGFKRFQLTASFSLPWPCRLLSLKRSQLNELCFTCPLQSPNFKKSYARAERATTSYDVLCNTVVHTPTSYVARRPS